MRSILAIAFISFASAACPNACSGHGTCNSLDVCTCYAESVVDDLSERDFMWTGADCSRMTCPRGVSWTQQDQTSQHLHVTDVECSDKGVCDPATGECACFAGYTGSACQRTTCPNDCSGHGTCRSNTDFTVDFSEAIHKEQLQVTGATDAQSVASYYDYFLVTYDDAWDSNMQYGCLCDVGFRGVDCSEVECPTSYDPMDQETCDKYADWEDLGTSGVGNVVLIVEFDQGASGDKRAYYNPIDEYPCNGAPAGDYCSGRGECDTGSGICKCFGGFTGPACEEVADIF